jgi:hypothetical protein
MQKKSKYTMPGSSTSYDDENPVIRQLRAENLELKGRLDDALTAMTKGSVISSYK